MVAMDLKGITWVGHVYQKFEAMCLEVEEVMYQDTVKYVENQVQTVGASVKKFYSDVMQDFLPPSSMDLVKGVAASNSPAELSIDVGIYKKAKVGIKEEDMKFDHKQLNDSQATVDLDKVLGHGPSFQGFEIEDTSFQPSFENTVKGACSSLYSKQYDNKMCSNCNLGIKEYSEEENLSLSEMFGAVTATAEDLNRALPFYELSGKIQDALCDQISISPTLATVEVNGCNCTEEICDQSENASKGTPYLFTDGKGSNEIENASKGRPALLTDGRNCNEIKNTSPISSCNDVSAEANAADICKNNGVVSLAGSFVNMDVQPSDFPVEIVLVCHPGLADDSTADAAESNIAEQELGTIQQVEENCVLVNGDELHFVPHKEHRHRPYKKKIRDAISSRMRSVRKQEYEQLAKCSGEKIISNQESTKSLMRTNLAGDMKRSLSQNHSELDWELL